MSDVCYRELHPSVWAVGGLLAAWIMWILGLGNTAGSHASKVVSRRHAAIGTVTGYTQLVEYNLMGSVLTGDDVGQIDS